MLCACESVDVNLLTEDQKERAVKLEYNRRRIQRLKTVRRQAQCNEQERNRKYRERKQANMNDLKDTVMKCVDICKENKEQAIRKDIDMCSQVHDELLQNELILEEKFRENKEQTKQLEKQAQIRHKMAVQRLHNENQHKADQVRAAQARVQWAKEQATAFSRARNRPKDTPVKTVCLD